MHPLHRLSLTGIRSAWMLLASLGAVFAQPAGTGLVEGRVQDPGRGDYLSNARVTVDGTSLAAQTDEFGEYRLAGVPAGDVKLTAFYTGLPAQTVTVRVAAGGRAVQNFELRKAPASDVVQLAAVTVTSQRDTSDASIAINEQRFAANMKTVLSADTFGEQSENNVGEFLKLMPGLNVNFVDQDARSASIRGLPAHATMVTSNGNALASAPLNTPNRTFEFEQISNNDIARIEVHRSLLPDMPAEGVGGTINLISKSAFERSRPEFKYRAYTNFNTTAMDWGRTPGPGREPTNKIKPGLDFTYINPLTKNFGVALSGAFSSKFNQQYYADRTWDLNANPATRVENPALRNLLVYDAPKDTDRISGRIMIDWRFAPHDVVSVGFSDQYYVATITTRRWELNTGATPGTIAPGYVQGRTSAGSSALTTAHNDKSGTTWTPEFKYTHNGRVWHLEAAGAFSHASNNYRNAEKGHFSQMNVQLMQLNAAGTGVVAPTVRFDYNGNYVPVATVTTATGAVVNSQDANDYLLNTAGTLKYQSLDVKKTLRLNARRHFDFLGVPLTVKTGGDVRQGLRDMRSTSTTYTFVGPDGRATTADNAFARYDLVDARYSTVTPPFGLQKFRWPDLYKMYDLFVQHPDWWTSNEATTHNNLVAGSRYLRETITSGFGRLDGSFFRNRLLLSGGWRYQNYQVYTESGEVDNLGQYLQDEDGGLILDPVSGQPIRLGGSALDNAQRTNVERGVKRRSRGDGFYPSISGTYRLTDNLQLRAAFANSINYPVMSDILATTTVSDYSANPRRLTVNKPLGPWTAHNYDLELQYFTATGGSVSVSWFRKKMKNFIFSGTYRAGTPEARAALERNGYSALIPLNYEVVEKYNAGNAKFDGWEFSVDQKLDPFLPEFGRGIRVFFNTSYRAAPTGLTSGSLDLEATRVFNWGINYNRGRFATHIKWNHVPEPKPVQPSTSHDGSKLQTDVDASFRVYRRLALFAGATNATAAPTQSYVYTENTPDYARRFRHHYYGVQIVAGVRGDF
jgi:iron complex outermembrane recepter protein